MGIFFHVSVNSVLEFDRYKSVVVIALLAIELIGSIFKSRRLPLIEFSLTLSIPASERKKTPGAKTGAKNNEPIKEPAIFSFLFIVFSIESFESCIMSLAKV